MKDEPSSIRSGLPLPPGPRGHILIGSAADLARDWLGFFERAARDYGDVVFFRFFHLPLCLVVHPREIEAVLVQHAADFHKSKDYRVLADILGNGLLTSEDSLWRRQRRLIQPAFHQERILSYSRVMTECAEASLREWRPGEERDVHEDMMRLTLEIVARALFSADVSGRAKNVGAAMQVVTGQFLGLADMAMILPSWVPLPGSIRLRRAVKQLDEIIFGIIRARRSAPGEHADLLETLLAVRDEDGQALSDRQVRDELMTLFLAGHETTAIALSWTAYLLSQNPEAEQRLHGELREVLDGRLPTPADLPRLRYTAMVLKESMRLYPPAWGVGRQALRDIELAGYRIPAGTNIFLAQWITQRDSRFFPNPARFDPERWDQESHASEKLPRFAYFPFGGGPRVCVGASFAMMEATLLLAVIAQRFRLAVVPEHPVEVFPSITLRPRHGIRVVVESRN